MAGTLVLYTHPQSRGRTARWMLEEVGEPYSVETLDYGTTMKAAPFLAINPMGKVPALRHGDAVVTETAAICAYLADAFPQAGLAPAPTSPQRAPYYRWMFFGAGPVESAMTNKALGVNVPPERERMVGYGSPAALLSTLESALSGSDYLAGDKFSAADVFLGSQIGFSMMFGTLEKRPVFEAYWQRISSRPAFQLARERDDALTAELGKAKA
jgi:glutathione S-transferase